jgi:hypothetical protein
MNPAAAVEACCACISANCLPLLAGLRVRGDVRVRLEGQTAWVYWLAGNHDVLHRVLAVGGAELFECRGGRWYRPGRHLPSFTVPDDAAARPLVGLLTPAPVAGATAPAVVRPLPLRLVRDSRPRPARALCCRLKELAGWAELATTRQLAALEAAVDEEGRVLVLGERLPPLAGGDRYWGQRLLLPLGWRAEPSLAEDVLREAVGLGPDQVGLLTQAGLEAVDRSALRPLTRAAVRLGMRQGGHIV